MKLVIINNTYLLLLMVMTLSCASQTNLSRAVSESKNNTPYLTYVDSLGKGYEKGLIGGMRMKVLFSNVNFNKQTKLVKVEGLATVLFNEKDTVGLCCVDFFIAQPIKGHLSKIRKLGKTNSNQVENTSKPDGYFSFQIKLEREDRLYFIGSDGAGLEEYNIGKVCFETLKITKEKQLGNN